MTAGHYLRLRRTAAGLSHEQLPIGPTAVLAIENNARRATDIEIWALASCFRFSMGVLEAISRGITVRLCRQCGCTELDACWNERAGCGCHWVESDLCSACAEKARPMPEGLAA